MCMLHFLFSKKLLKDTKGVASVEMAFALPIFLAFMLGIIGSGHIFWVNNSLQYALDQAGRYAMLNPTASNTNITDVITANIHGINVDNLNVTIQDSVSGAVTNRTIILDYDYDFSVGFITFLPSTLTSQVTVPTINE
jgi:Flp pilus assembly protein TadG